MSFLSDYLYQYFDEVSYKEFYRDVFPVGSFEQKGVFEKGKYNKDTKSKGEMNNVFQM